MRSVPFKKHSLLFAPMEGVTDEHYRKVVMEQFPEWDHFSTDFIRIPTNAKLKKSQIREHVGSSIIENKKYLKRTTLQFLTTKRASTEDAVEKFNEMGIPYIDLNLGCPSKKVNSHGGGAVLLKELDALREIIRSIRENFERVFTVKIRTGYSDTSFFEDIIQMFQDEKVDGITIHGRTRDQLYRGEADWSYIKKAAHSLAIPVTGNGDIKSTGDIFNMFEQTDCHSIMVGRGAIAKPWLATEYKKDCLEFTLRETHEVLHDFFYYLEDSYKRAGRIDLFILGRFKSFCRYIFDNDRYDQEDKTNLFRSQTLLDFNKHLATLLH